MMKENKKKDIEKPEDWPSNGREALLSNVMNFFDEFMKNPNFSNKENLLNLLNQNDLNETNDFGLVRMTNYEVYLINLIYINSIMTNCVDGALFIYRYLMRTIYLRKVVFVIENLNKSSNNIASFFNKNIYVKNLHPALQLFFYVYANYSFNNDESFAKILIKYMTLSYDKLLEADIYNLLTSFSLLLQNLSFNNSVYLMEIAKFSRNDIVELLNIYAKFSNRLNINVKNKPYYGVISVIIANLIIKSRNGYNQGFIYKCIKSSDMKLASSNMQLWMKRTEFLNDDTEGCISKDLLSNMDGWKKYEWMKNENYDYYTTFVSSFSKTKPNELMLDKYGDSWIGFKNDKIASSIAPIITKIPITKDNKQIYKDVVRFCQVMSYDVIYDINVYKEEINLIANIINNFNIPDVDKNDLFNNIIKYWRYSIKGTNWACENERRFEIIIQEHYKYNEIDIDDTFLKVKTYLIMCPDFCHMEDWAIKNKIRYNLEEKYKINNKPYIYCEDCFYRSFDYYIKSDNQKMCCPVCGSSKFYERNKTKIQ